MEQFFWQKIHISDDSASWRWAASLFISIILFPTFGSVIDLIVIGMAIFSVNYWVFANLHLNRIEQTTSYIVLAYLAVVVVLGPLMNENTLESVWLGLSNIGLICLVLIPPALRYCKVDLHKKWLVLAFPITSFIMAAGLIAEAIVNYPLVRAELLSGNALILAFLASVSMLGCAVYGFEERKLRLIIFFLGFVLSAITLIATGSRAPIAITFFLSISYILFTAIRTKRWKAIYFFLILSVISIVAGLLLSQTQVGKNFYERSSHLASAVTSGNLFQSADLSSQMRFSYYSTGLQLAKENLFTGVGRANIIEMAKQLAAEENKSWYGKTHLHNGFLTEITSNGIIGLFCLILLMLLPIIISRNGSRMEIDFSWLLSVFIIGYSMTNIAFYHDTMVFSFVVYCLLISTISNRQKNEADNTQTILTAG